MTDEQLQFEISQYLDGTLPESGRSALEARLKTDAAARKVLEEFRRINDLLDAALPEPEVDWDKMSRRISAAVSQTAMDEVVAAAEQARAPWRWRAAVALAAGLLLAASAALFLRPARKTEPMVAGSNVVMPPRLTQIAVLQTPQPVGQALAEVEIGEARGLLAQFVGPYPADLTVSESRVAIAGLPVPADDEPMPIQ